MGADHFGLPPYGIEEIPPQKPPLGRRFKIGFWIKRKGL